MPSRNPMQKIKTLLVWSALIFAFCLAYTSMHRQEPEIFRSFPDFQQDAAGGRVAAAAITEGGLDVRLTNGQHYRIKTAITEEILEELEQHEVNLEWSRESLPPGGFNAASLLGAAIPLLILAALFVFFLKRVKVGQMGIMKMLKSPARELAAEKRLSFADVGGLSKAKEELKDVISFLRDPARWHSMGARAPRGILLEGPPGCGKTLLAKAVAGETSAKFFHISASEFVEMFVGVGAARVRDMFDNARKQTPAVIFIDELDAVGRRRGSGVGMGHDEREQTLNQLLVCLDGMETNDEVVVIAATNRADILDRALLRPGRFDRRIDVSQPDAGDREEILAVHVRNKKLAADVSLQEIALLSEGLNGADLEGLANEAALCALRRSADGRPEAVLEVSVQHFLETLEIFRRRSGDFSKIDSVLIESATQLARSTGRTAGRVVQADGSSLEGEILWADGRFIKLRESSSGRCLLLSKDQIVRIEVLPGTEQACDGEALSDPWAQTPPGCA